MKKLRDRGGLLLGGLQIALGFAGDWEILLEIKRWENLATRSEPGDDVVAHLFAMHCATLVVCVFYVLPV